MKEKYFLNSMSVQAHASMTSLHFHSVRAGHHFFLCHVLCIHNHNPTFLSRVLLYLDHKCRWVGCLGCVVVSRAPMLIPRGLGNGYSSSWLRIINDERRFHRSNQITARTLQPRTTLAPGNRIVNQVEKCPAPTLFSLHVKRRQHRNT